MNNKDFLILNPSKIITYLSNKINAREITKLKNLVKEQSRKLLKLSRNHLRFAKSIKNIQGWRQKVSRGYYCCYIASRALRLSCFGDYSTEVKDHQKISNLPDDFNDKAVWEDFLTKFRSDRNLSDYDHEGKTEELEYVPDLYLAKAEQFYKKVFFYLKERGDI